MARWGRDRPADAVEDNWDLDRIGVAAGCIADRVVGIALPEGHSRFVDLEEERESHWITVSTRHNIQNERTY